MPFPIVVANGRAPGQLLVDANATVYEFNPLEIGSWDSNVRNFVNSRYIGSRLNGGQPINDNVCLSNYDNIGFVVGTSSALFNGALRSVSSNGIISSVIQSVLTNLAEDDEDIAFYPNPFFGVQNVTQAIRQAGNLTLTDGGLDNQNIPLWPLIQPEREVDAILTVDASADTTYNWPNGSSLVTTYRRVVNLTDRTTKTLSFPHVPDTQTFVNLGLNRRVTFFGCNATNGTNPSIPPPILIYIPNEPYSYFSNFSTFDGEYNHNDIYGTIQNGLNIATAGNSTRQQQCIACAVIRRGLERANATIPQTCQDCFSEMCWDGTVNSTQPGMALLAPPLRLASASSGSGATGSRGSGGSNTGPNLAQSSGAGASASTTARSLANRAVESVDTKWAITAAILLAATGPALM